MEQQRENILKILKNEQKENVSAVILDGEMGTASWMAREIIEHETGKGSWYEAFWVSVTKTYDTKLVFKAIYDQLSSGSIPEEWEYEDENTELEKAAEGLKVTAVEWEQEEYRNAGQEAKEETIGNLKQKIQEQLEKRTRVCHRGTKYLLLVLDYEGNNFDNHEFQQNILPVLSSVDKNHLKIVITRCKTGRSGADNVEQTIKEINLGALLPEEASSLFEKSVGHTSDGIHDFKRLSDVIAKERSMCLPAPITVIAGALKYFSQHHNEALTLERALVKAAYYEKPSQVVNPLVYCAYDMMQSDVTKNCFWHSLQFVRNYGGLHYNELITHWIMEGYFDPFDHIEKAYQAGHLVLMELTDRAMLKMQENNIVAVEGAALNMIDTRLRGFGGTASLGLVRVFENGGGFGRVTHIDRMIKSLRNPKNVKDVSTLLIDGARVNSEVHEEFFSSMPGLKVLAVFNSVSKPLISSLSGLEQLNILVLRKCVSLDDITNLSNLKTLTVLEISDCKAGNSLQDKLFDEMTQLQSLNLSGLQIKSLPSLSNLRELRLLILRRCSRLEKMRRLIGLGKLEILDLSDAHSLEIFDDTAFSEIPKIQLIDLSHTKIQKLPVFGELKDLTRILLRGCNNTREVPGLKGLTNLQILDLSGASAFRNFKFKDSIAELNHLTILNMSKTKISKLPPMPSNLSELNLSGCSELVDVSSIASLHNLESLYVFDAPKLAKINDEVFQHLTYLQYLDLSNTKVENLPSLSNLRNLCQLLLKDCTSLINLPNMEGLTRLVELDLRGCSALQQLKEKIESLKKDMPCLNIALTMQNGDNLDETTKAKGIGLPP